MLRSIKRPKFSHISRLRWLIPRSRKAWKRIILTSLLLYLTLWYALPFAFPYRDEAVNGSAPSFLLLDRNGKPLQHNSREDYYRLQKVSLSEIPDDLIHATIAAEDKRFYSHGGIDPLAICRAIKDAITTRRLVSGASTITQQTVKLSQKRVPRTIKNKIIEALTARHLELTCDKQTILTSYFNHLDYGNHTLGPKQAAHYYFGKPLNQLSLAECALLAGIPQSPNRHNPRRHPKRAKNRRDWVLQRMQIVHHISAERIQRAIDEPIQLAPHHHISNTPQLATYVASKYKPSAFPPQGILTTIDAQLQHFAQTTLHQEILQLKHKHIQNGAVVIIDNHTREILALVGTHDFHASAAGQINAALVPRSTGSSLKPLTYTLAFDNLHLTPASIVPDIKTIYAGERGPEEFVNYDHTHQGPITIHQALGNSLNTPAVRILNRLGGAATLHQLYLQLGFKHLNPDPKSYGLSIALGTAPVTLLEATNAFATLSNNGTYRPTSILHSPVNNVTITDKLFSSNAAYLVTSILTDNTARVHSFGVHSNLRLPFPCAVKTGTSTDFRDNWCLGYTPDYSVGVWLGNLDNSPMRGITGVTGAGAIFKKIMLKLYQHKATSKFKTPPNITKIIIDPHTGKILPKNHPRYPIAITTYAPIDLLPPTSLKSDYSPDSKIYLNNLYRDWLATHPNKPFICNNLPNQGYHLHILSPANQSQYLLDPDLPNQGKFLPLSSNSHNPTSWKSDTLTITQHHGTPTAILTPGTHTITVTDTITHQSCSAQFTVKEL